MAEQIITLEPEDDKVSIRDRLAWVDAGRVLVVLPPKNEPVRDRLGLTLLQRQAGRQNVELGLVTTNPSIVTEARDLGILVFPSVEMGQSRKWRWPWRPLDKPRAPLAPRPPDPGDVREMHRRTRPRPPWRRWLNRFGGIALFIFALISLGVGAVYVVPGATVVLYPAVQDLSVTAMVVGDPSIEQADYEAGLVPARLLRVEVSWRGAAATTGFSDVPDTPATGTVAFTQRASQAGPVTVPAGTLVRTSAGTTIRFRTTTLVEVPGTLGVMVQAPVVALDAGPRGNVDSNLINKIEGALALQLSVRNLSPTEGGSVRQVKAVTQADLDRLRDQVLQQLFQLAKAEIPNWMTESEFLVEESLTLFLVTDEDPNRYVGERADSVELHMSALIQGYVVDASQGYSVIYTALANTAERPAGYRLLPESISPPRRGEVLKVDEEGRVTFLMQGRAKVAAEIDQEYIVEKIRGQELGRAVAWIMQEIPLQKEPAVQVWPNWFGRLPYLPIRISTRVEIPE